LEEYLWFGRFGKERDGNRYQKQYINVIPFKLSPNDYKDWKQKNFKNAL